MTKTELISSISTDVGMTKSDVEKVLDSFLQTVTHALKKEDEVRLVGFGTFGTRHRKETKARNPKTGEPVTVPASCVAFFKPGKGLRDAVNSK